MTNHEAMQMALDALEHAEHGLDWYASTHPESLSEADSEMAEQINRAKTALRTQIAKPDPVVPEAHNIRDVVRISDQSISIHFASCRAASAFEAAIKAAPQPEVE